MVDALADAGEIEGAEKVAEPGAEGAVEPGAEPGAKEASAKTEAGAEAGKEKGEAEQKWRDDWREALARKDEKTLGRLKRFASPENLVASLLAAEAKIRSGQIKSSLPEKPTPEQLAAWRKENDVPEKPDGYTVEWPKGYEASPSDKQELAEFQEAMHGLNVPAGTVKAAFATYAAIKEKAGQAAYEAIADRRVKNVTELKSEYGRDFNANVKIADSFLASHAPDGDGKVIANLRLADGTALGEHPAFVRMMVNAGRAYADDETMIGAMDGSGGKSLDDQYKAGLALMTSKDPAERKKYYSDEHQEKMKRLVDARNKQRR